MLRLLRCTALAKTTGQESNRVMTPLELLNSKKAQILVQAALAVMVGVLGGTLVLVQVPPKWKIALLIVVGALTSALIIRNTKRVLLSALVFVVPFFIGTGLPSLLTRENHVGLSTSIYIEFMDVLVLALLFLRLAQKANRHGVIRLFPEVTVPALAWIVVSGLSSAVASDPGLVAIQLFGMGRLFVLYLVVANSVEDEADVTWVVWAILLGAFTQGILGSYQAITRHPLGLAFLGEGSDILQFNMGRSVAYRAVGTIGHGNGYGMYLSATMPFALGLLFTDKRRLHKVLAIAVLCVGIIGLVFSLSRGSWLSFSATCFVILVLAIHRRRRVGHIGWLFAGAVLLSVIALTLGQQNLIMDRIKSDDGGAAYARIALAEGAARMIRDHPALGVGLNNYSLVMRKYDMASFGREGLVIVHNIFLLIAAETGLIGLAVFLWLMASLMIRAWRIASGIVGDTAWVAGVGVLSGLIALTLHGMVDYAMLANAPLFRLFWLFGAMCVGLSAKAGHD